MAEVIIDPEYLQEIQNHQKKGEEQKWAKMPHPVEDSKYNSKKSELAQEYGLPVCIFENEKQIHALTQTPVSFFAEARKRFTGNEDYKGDLLVFSEENPQNIQFVDLSDEDFGTTSPLSEED